MRARAECRADCRNEQRKNNRGSSRRIGFIMCQRLIPAASGQVQLSASVHAHFQSGFWKNVRRRRVVEAECCDAIVIERKR